MDNDWWRKASKKYIKRAQPPEDRPLPSDALLDSDSSDSEATPEPPEDKVGMGIAIPELTHCLRCKKKTPSLNGTVVKAASNRYQARGQCKDCGFAKYAFVKKS